MNLYLHFPFCRRKCAYCALKSRAGASESVRNAYAARLADEIRARPESGWNTVYLGGGTPALCDLGPIFRVLRERGLSRDAEFTVELHPADATPGTLVALAAGGVNRISLGVQSFDDATLAAMGRTHTSAEAVEAFEAVRRVFPNSGFDLIVGHPAPPGARTHREILPRMLERLRPAHVSAYSLIREPGTALDKDIRRGRAVLPGDDQTLDALAEVAGMLAAAGLDRYEISNHARAGFECRHNCAVWRGEDYVGLGDGAHGREGLVRTVGEGNGYVRRKVSALEDAQERELFALRTRAGFDPDAAVARRPVLAPLLEGWRRELDFNVAEGLLARRGTAYAPTARGMEVCDAIIGGLLADVKVS
ncbi:MAG: coproporphyrinogen III oxidase family protein [Kiritimatiellae bacterium]|nr:coproporphyrinogen III oxidase family protein [Kiritimatiellia bacterium]